VIRLFDLLLRDLFVNRVPGITTQQQVRFQPPDDDLRTFVRGTLNAPALGVFLADVRDNRKLRSNETIRRVEGGDVISEPAPHRVDCHYLITAWDPAVPNDGTLNEHQLLYDALAELLRSMPLNPTRIYGTGNPLLAPWHPLLRDADLPTTAPTVEGFQRLAELWHGMGTTARWKPAIHLIATLPVLRDPIPEGPMVITQITDYGFLEDGVVVDPERWIIIGGRITRTDAAGALQPIVNAWVRLQPPPGGLELETKTDANGRYLLQWPMRRVSVPEKYTIRSGATGFTDGTRDVHFPGDNISYDLTLS
jgi:hypothetical protein